MTRWAPSSSAAPSGPDRYCASGSISDDPLFLTELTSVDTRRTARPSDPEETAGCMTLSRCSFSALAGSSQSAQSPGATTIGVRSWILPISSVASVVMIVRHLGVLPQFVEAGEGEDAAVGPVDVERLLDLRLRLGLPFVVAVGRDEAAALGEGGPERGLDRHRLGPRVDQPGAALDVLGPERHQPPADQPQFPLVLVVEHGVDALGRRHVV